MHPSTLSVWIACGLVTRCTPGMRASVPFVGLCLSGNAREASLSSIRSANDFSGVTSHNSNGEWTSLARLQSFPPLLSCYARTCVYGASSSSFSHALHKHPTLEIGSSKIRAYCSCCFKIVIPGTRQDGCSCIATRVIYPRTRSNVMCRAQILGHL